MSQLYPHLPHNLFFLLNYLELKYVCIQNYNLGANYCTVLHEKGGVIIYVHNSLNFIDITSMKYCEEQDIEICALKPQLNSVNICVYTPHTGNFNYFIHKLDVILHICILHI